MRRPMSPYSPKPSKGLPLTRQSSYCRDFFSSLPDQLELLCAGEPLDTGFLPGRLRTIPERSRENQLDRPAAPRVFRPERRTVVLPDPPIEVGRDPDIERPVRALENIEVIHGPILHPFEEPSHVREPVRIPVEIHEDEAILLDLPLLVERMDR